MATQFIKCTWHGTRSGMTMAVGTGAVDDMLARCTRLGYCSSGVWVVARRSSDDMLAMTYTLWLLLGGVSCGAKVITLMTLSSPWCGLVMICSSRCPRSGYCSRGGGRGAKVGAMICSSRHTPSGYPARGCGSWREGAALAWTGADFGALELVTGARVACLSRARHVLLYN